jgi:hypothetical protein
MIRIRSREWSPTHPFSKTFQSALSPDNCVKSPAELETSILDLFSDESSITSLIESCSVRQGDIEILIDVVGWVSTSALGFAELDLMEVHSCASLFLRPHPLAFAAKLSSEN